MNPLLLISFAVICNTSTPRNVPLFINLVQGKNNVSLNRKMTFSCDKNTKTLHQHSDNPDTSEHSHLIQKRSFGKSRTFTWILGNKHTDHLTKSVWIMTYKQTSYDNLTCISQTLQRPFDKPSMSLVFFTALEHQ